MTPAAFVTMCESMYGAGWQSKLARELVRDIRTIRRWISAARDVWISCSVMAQQSAA